MKKFARGRWAHHFVAGGEHRAYGHRIRGRVHRIQEALWGWAAGMGRPRLFPYGIGKNRSVRPS